MEAEGKLQVVLLGSTGSGKSASGNSILGEKVFKSYASTQSVTLSYQSETRTINGTEVTVVDTPGWHCTKMSVDEVASALKEAIVSLNGPYAFLMVIPIGSFTNKEIQMIEKLNQVLGEEFMKQTTILFSFSDNLESKSFDQFLKEEKGELHIIIEHCGNRVYTWNNKNISTVCKLDEMLQDLKKTQRMNDSSKNCCQNALFSQPEPDVNTSDETGFPDVEMKRTKRETPEPLDKPNEEVRVVVLGMAGAGKTSTIRTLSEQNQGQTERSMPNVHMTSRSGMNFKLIDSSGFKNANEVESVISQAFSDASPGPHVIMIVIKVTEETFTMINNIQVCLDNSAKKRTMIVFSRKDELEDKPIDELIKGSSELNEIVQMHESRYSALNNNINDQTQVNKLFEKILAIYHDNDRQFVDEASGQHGRENPNKQETTTTTTTTTTTIL